MLFGFPRHRAFPSRISLRLQLPNAQLFKIIFWSLKSLTCSIQLSAAATRRIHKHRPFPTRKFFCLLSSAPGSPAAAVISVAAKGFFVMFVAVVAAGIVATTRSKLSPSHFMNIANQSVYSGTLNRRHWRRKETEASAVAHLGSLVLPVLSATFNYY